MKPHLLALIFTLLTLTGCGGGGGGGGSDAHKNYSIGGSVSGLSGTLILKNNGNNPLTISTDGAFFFTTEITTDGSYDVTVTTQPDGQTCVVTDDAGTVAAADITNISISCNADSDNSGGDSSSFTLGGSVSGLTGTLVLQNSSNGESLSLSENGAFSFTRKLADEAVYAVAVATQPDGQTCVVTDDAGTVAAADISNISVNCSTDSFTLGGSVSGLAGTLVLQNSSNGESLSLSDDGAFSFTQALADEAVYDVSMITQPAGEKCELNNGSGIIDSSNVSNISVSCSSLNWGLINYGITTEAPSVVSMAFRAVDKTNGAPVVGLTADDIDYFMVLEDDKEVTQRESFKDLQPVDQTSYTFYTVLALDISSSLLSADIELVKNTAKAIIADPVTGESKLLPNQQVAIYTFDGDVTEIATYTSNANALLTAIDGISRGGPSTNLYGAIVTGMNRWANSFTLDEVTYGAMVVVTDGDDTSGVMSELEAINAVNNKALYAIPVGSEVDLSTLENIAGAEHVFPASDYSQLGTVFDQVVGELNSFSDGLYFLYYASPKRAGWHTIDISVVDNHNTAGDASITGSFNADGFADVTPEVVISGKGYIINDNPATWTVRTRWSNDPANYSWEVTDPDAVLTVTPNDADSARAILSSTSSQTGQTSVTVTDLNWNISASKNVDILPPKPVVTKKDDYLSVTLHWSAMPEATGYRVYWNTTGNVSSSDTLLANTTLTQVTHTDLDPAQTYYYIIVPAVPYTTEASAEISVQPLSRAISAGSYHSCVLDSKLGVLCWGNNYNGETNEPTLTNPMEVTAGERHTCALDDSGVVCWGLNDHGQTDVPVLTNPVAVAAGAYHTCALDDSGVVCWGLNANQQTWVPAPITNPVAITAGSQHTCILDDTRMDPLVCWGRNYGRPALTNTNPVAITAGEHHTCALDDSGVVCWGFNSGGQTDVPVLTNPVAVTAGGHHTCALDDSGVVCWGYNGEEQTNVPALTNPVAVVAGGRYSCALDDRGVICWGSNSTGQTDVPLQLQR